jgi:hypothetical protein
VHAELFVLKPVGKKPLGGEEVDGKIKNGS